MKGLSRKIKDMVRDIGADAAARKFTNKPSSFSFLFFHFFLLFLSSTKR